MTERINNVRDLEVYQIAFDTAMQIFQMTKSFPVEERYSLIDQIRRSSRSVCSNLSESWRKRRYSRPFRFSGTRVTITDSNCVTVGNKAVFINKLSDASQEAGETQTWLEFALKCGYINKQVFDKLDEKYEHIFAMLITMERKVDSFCK